MLNHNRTRDTGLLMRRLCTLSISTSSSSLPCRRPPCRRPGVLGVGRPSDLLDHEYDPLAEAAAPVRQRGVTSRRLRPHRVSSPWGRGGSPADTDGPLFAGLCLSPPLLCIARRTCMTKLAHPAASGPTAPTVPTARLTGSAPGRALHPSWTAPGSAPAAGATAPGGVSFEVLSPPSASTRC